jgi:hypothetical protein
MAPPRNSRAYSVALRTDDQMRSLHSARHATVAPQVDPAHRGSRRGEVNRQQLGFTVGEPLLRRRALALGAMPVAAGVVGAARVRTLLAALNVSAEDCRASALDGRHDLELTQAHVTDMGSTPSGPVVAEDVRDLERRAGQRARRLRRAMLPPERDAPAGW